MTRIKLLRQNKGMTNADFARAARLYISEAHKVNRGDYRCGPTVRQRIAAALGSPEAELFDADGWPLLVAPTPAEVAL